MEMTFPAMNLSAISAFYQGIEEYTPLQVVQQGGFGLAGKLLHVFEVDFTVFVERSGKSFVGGIDVGQPVFVEGSGVVEYVGWSA